MSDQAIDPVRALLAEQVPARWALSLYSTAREASGVFIPARAEHHSVGVRGQAVDAERARVEAARRARGRLRRYCAHNRLNRLGTLTYAGEGCHDERQVRSHVGEFFRRLRRDLDDVPFPYAWVPEWHKSGHGLHVHFGLGRYTQRSAIDSAWGRGFVHIKLLGDLSMGSGALAQSRWVAVYLSKYVTKDFLDATRPMGLHRFDVAEGFQPSRQLLTGLTADDVLGQASQLLGSQPLRRWSSVEAPDWQGGSAIWAQWA